MLTHWGWVTHICVGKLIIIIGSDNGLLPVRHQSIIWSNAEILWIGPSASVKYKSIYKISIRDNAFENVICEMAAILSRGGRWVKRQRLDVYNHEYLEQKCFLYDVSSYDKDHQVLGLTQWPLGDVALFVYLFFSDTFSCVVKLVVIWASNSPQLNAKRLPLWKIWFFSCICLVASANKLLPVVKVIWCHMESQGVNELIVLHEVRLNTQKKLFDICLA